VVNIEPGDLSLPAVDEAVVALDRGGIVVLPTETVYGLCCLSGCKSAVERVYAAKHRGLDKPLPYLLPDRSNVDHMMDSIPGPALRLMDRFWPGPLTLVLGPGDGVAIRVPDHPFTRAVLNGVSGLAYATSVNLAGEPPATSIDQVDPSIRPLVDVMFDGGTSSLSRASAVVRVPDVGPARVLRVGSLDDEEIRRIGGYTVALVCTGNTCRSPMAAAVLEKMIRERGEADSGWRVLSAGVSAMPGAPMTPEAAAVLGHAGIEPGVHRAQPWTADLAREVDAVWALSSSHLTGVRELTPGFDGEVQLLDLDGTSVPDPIGYGQETYGRCLDVITGHLGRRLGSLEDGSSS